MAERDPILERFRKLCLALPDTTEKQTWGHPSWKASHRLFASYDHYKGRDCLCFLVEVDFRDALVRDKRFIDVGFTHGNKTWVGLPAEGHIAWREVKELLGRAHQLVWKAPRPRTR